MTKLNFKPIYAKNNSDWRIRYQSNGNWELQERVGLKEGIDRRTNQPWRSLNTNMPYSDAILAIARYDMPAPRKEA